LTALQHALNLNPNDLVALSLSHEMLLAAGEIEEASRRAQQLLKLAPLDLLTLRRLVDCRCQLKLTQGAACLETVRLLRRTQQVSQNPFLTHETLASFFLAQDKPQKALAAQRDFSEAHPQCLDGRQHYSELLAATGLADRLPAELEVWKLPMAKHCHGLCHAHQPSGSLRA
jgi:tetratricopeptide (TPR) repeat protein